MRSFIPAIFLVLFVFASAVPAVAKEPAEVGSRAGAAVAQAKGKKKESKKAPEAQAFGEIRVADRPLAVRAGRDKETEFVRLLKAGQRVRVDFQKDGWFAVFAPEEKVRDLSRAWGYGRDKYLIPEKKYAGQPLSDEAAAPAAPKAQNTPPKPAKAVKETAAKETGTTKPGQKQKRDAAGDAATGYTVLERHADTLRPQAPAVLRVSINVSAPPAADALRKIVRDIWKAERRKNEELQVEVLLPGMDQGGLAYAVARFHDDGRLREFWWRDVVLRPKP